MRLANNYLTTRAWRCLIFRNITCDL